MINRYRYIIYIRTHTPSLSQTHARARTHFLSPDYPSCAPTTPDPGSSIPKPASYGTQDPLCDSHDEILPAGLARLVEREVAFNVAPPQVSALLVQQFQGLKLALRRSTVRWPAGLKARGKGILMSRVESSFILYQIISKFIFLIFHILLFERKAHLSLSIIQ